MEPLISKLFMAPMAEVTTPSLRKIIRGYSTEVVLYSEMLSAGAVASAAAHNEPVVSKYHFDDPFIYQIVGSVPHVMAKACRMLSSRGCYSIDINMGCPNHDIVKKGWGARLLTDRKKAQNIIRACRQATETKLSVKMRTGYEENNISYFTEFITMLEDEGVDFITIHPRYAKLAFKRHADWDLIAIARERLGIPVIGNGDITSPELFLKRLRETKCHGIMIGRKAIISPWIFRICSDLMEGRDSVLVVNIRDTFIKTLDYLAEYLPRHLHRSRSHRFCQYYCKNVTFSHELFRKIRQLEAIEPIKEVVDDYFQRNENESIRTYTIHGERVSTV